MIWSTYGHVYDMVILVMGIVYSYEGYINHGYNDDYDMVLLLMVIKVIYVA